MNANLHVRLIQSCLSAVNTVSIQDTSHKIFLLGVLIDKKGVLILFKHSRTATRKRCNTFIGMVREVKTMSRYACKKMKRRKRGCIIVREEANRKMGVHIYGI